MNNNQMDADLRRLVKDLRKRGAVIELNNSQHFDVYLNGVKITTIAPRNRHWKVNSMKHLRPAFPGLK